MDNIKRGPYKIISSRNVYKNPWISVREDRVIHDAGKEGMFGVVEMKGGSTVLALDHNNDVYLVKEYKYGIGQDSLELMSGGLDGAETPLDAAKRELKEEIGLEASRWIDLGVVNPFTTIIKSPNFIFLATGLKEGEQHLDEWESVHIVKVPFSKAIDMVINSEITHGASCVCLLKAERYLRGLNSATY